MITTYNPAENKKQAQNKTFKITLPPECCGILKRGWEPKEVESLTITIRKQDTAENGKLAAVIINNEPTARLIEYNRLDNGKIVLIDPNKYDLEYPYFYNKDRKGEEPIVLRKKDAAKRLKVLGVVQTIATLLK